MKWFFFSLLLFTISGHAQVKGCTDPQATNYNPQATVNDGSCIYEETIVATTTSTNLPDKLEETSGLLFWDTRLITHNDSNDTSLYAVDPEKGEIIEEFDLKGTKNTDWEDLAQDENYVYVGDFGNNLSGNRTDLKILRIKKKSLFENAPQIDTINFQYEDQTDFSPKPANTTDFDCEAFMATQDSLYLFTKQWTGQGSSVYAIPKIPGDYAAQLKTTLDVSGLVTGATNLEAQNLVALCGYSPALEPFVYVIYDYENHDFEVGNKRKFRLELPFHQVEGITTKDGLNYYISNEKFTKPPFINAPQRMHTLDFTEYLDEYLDMKNLDLERTEKIDKRTGFIVFPQPADAQITIDNLPTTPLAYILSNMNGALLQTGLINVQNNAIDLSPLSAGTYFLKFDEINTKTFKVIKR